MFVAFGRATWVPFFSGGDDELTAIEAV